MSRLAAIANQKENKAWLRFPAGFKSNVFKMENNGKPPRAESISFFYQAVALLFDYAHIDFTDYFDQVVY